LRRKGLRGTGPGKVQLSIYRAAARLYNEAMIRPRLNWPKYWAPGINPLNA